MMRIVIVILLQTFLWTVITGDSEVSCVFMESCILPCSFQGDTDVIIHWIQVSAGNSPVHSFYHNKDQLAHQDQRFNGRTSLFTDQISGGNASLQLTGLQVQDQGRYKCYTGSNRGRKESFINLKVDAPVGKVDLQQVGNRITCSSERIYPQPELTWSTSPPSTVTFKNQAEVQETEQLLYNIRSSLTVSDSDSDLSYSCSISTRRNRRRATLFKTTSVNISHTEATLSCKASHTKPLIGFSLTWKYNHSQIILTQTRTDVPSSVSEGWSQQVKGVSESGSLMLQDLSPHHGGIYTCELSDAEETLTTNTFLRIESPDSTNVIIGGVVGGIFVIALAVGLVLYLKKIKERLSCQQRSNRRESNNGDTQKERELENIDRKVSHQNGEKHTLVRLLQDEDKGH